MIWKPNVTVAAVIERMDKFLLVEEHTSQGCSSTSPPDIWKQTNRCCRPWCVKRGKNRPTISSRSIWSASIAGMRMHPTPPICASPTAAASRAMTGQALDSGIVRAVWMTPDEIRATRSRHRSPLILQCVEDYLAGKRYPLELVTHYD